MPLSESSRKFNRDLDEFRELYEAAKERNDPRQQTEQLFKAVQYCLRWSFPAPGWLQTAFREPTRAWMDGESDSLDDAFGVRQ